MRTLMMMLVAMLLGIVLGAAAVDRLHGDPATDPVGVVSVNAGPSIDAIRSLAVLTTSQVTVSDVQLTELRGYTGASKAALLVRGDFTLGTDLSKAAFERVDPDRRHVTLMLPLPTASSPRVDLTRTKLVSLTSEGLWEIVPSTATTTAVTDAAYRDAQELVLHASGERQWVERSQRSAEQLLIGYFGSIGWTVDVLWST